MLTFNRNYAYIAIIILLLIILGYMFASPINIKKTLPNSLQQLFESRVNGPTMLKLYSCKDNQWDVRYSLRVEETGDAGTDYYLNEGTLSHNCGANLPPQVQPNPACSITGLLDCKEPVQC